MSEITRYDPNYAEEMMEPQVDGGYVRLDCYLDAIKERNALLAELSQIAKLIHYPDCWDTAAYATLFDALREVINFNCVPCGQKNKIGEAK